MCIALPAQVLRVEPGHAWVVTREGPRRVSTALVGEPAPGDWLLVFLDSARSVIDADRAAEVEALLDLVQAAMGAPSPADALPDFDLPSRLDTAALSRLTGQAPAGAAPVQPTASHGALP